MKMERHGQFTVAMLKCAKHWHEATQHAAEIRLAGCRCTRASVTRGEQSTEVWPRRILTCAQIAPVAAVALQALADRLMRVCENPQQPSFNHFLFESVAALIRFGCEANPGMVAQFESSLFPAFEKVLQVRAWVFFAGRQRVRR